MTTNLTGSHRPCTLRQLPVGGRPSVNVISKHTYGQLVGYEIGNGGSEVGVSARMGYAEGN
jgi:hypothetical protein